MEIKKINDNKILVEKKILETKYKIPDQTRHGKTVLDGEVIMVGKDVTFVKVGDIIAYDAYLKNDTTNPSGITPLHVMDVAAVHLVYEGKK